MKVEVISRETIKPSTPTPSQLQNIQFSSLDQLATSNYVTILLFYQSDDNIDREFKQVKRSDQLKRSLSETLTHFYPLAGRIKDGFYIDCNDEGVDFFEARVNCQLSEFLEQVNIDQLDQFLPCDPSVTEAELGTKVVMAIQVNIFECGSFAIGMCFSHKIGDGVSLATFIKGWAAISRGASEAIPCMCFDLSSHFPIKDWSHLMSSNQGMKQNIITKRFVFDASKIAALRAFNSTTEKSSNVEYPTRVELVSALLWRCAMAVARLRTERMRAFAAIHAVNLRGRMVPPLSNNYFGNVSRPTITQFITEEMESEYHDLVGNIRDAVRKIDGKYVMELQSGNEGFMNYIEEAKKRFSESEIVIFNFNSWCKFPFYEADFGWGEPIWVATTKVPGKNLVIFIDTKSGDGIEAWVNMLEEDMAELEHDQEFLSFVSNK